MTRDAAYEQAIEGDACIDGDLMAPASWLVQPGKNYFSWSFLPPWPAAGRSQRIDCSWGYLLNFSCLLE
jgi:hypothetical protein